MEFKIKTFKELLGLHFNIPSFQRGYRWEKENVEALLNDIQEFANKEKKEPDEFYCLQPIVVRKNKLLSDEKGYEVYDLLDGQQRLTTLWLVLNSSNFKTLWDALDRDHEPLYTMEYESRENLFSIVVDDNHEKFENIDLYYLKSALEFINNWKGDPLSVVYSINSKSPSGIGNDVRFIWYEFDKEVNTLNTEDDGQSDSIKVFSRLNYGKVPLTDTELIKALILQCDIYPNNDSEIGKNAMKEHLFRIATEWDDIEKGLHNDSFWGMLTPEDYKPSNHMELLLKFVADKIQTENNYNIIDKQRKDFHIISTFLGINETITVEQYASRVDILWNTIRDTYVAMKNWYTSDEVYHLIGLIVLIKGGVNPIPLLSSIYKNYILKDKVSFKIYLEGEIGKLIKITDKWDKDSPKAGSILELNELRYNKNNPTMIKILEAFNIYIHLNMKSFGSRFNFKEFKDKKVTSLEHIHPQHLEFEDSTTYEDVVEWLQDTIRIISENPELSSNTKILDSCKELNKFLVDSNTYEENISKCQDHAEKIDKILDNHAGMEDGHMHTLYNMALVDKDTNAALSNNLIDTKRNILQDREKKDNIYIPIGTNFVFNKHFSPHISGMKFWSKEDREPYYNQIKKAYQYFTSKI